MPATPNAARYQELVEGQDELGVAVWTEHTIPVRAVVPEALGAQVPVGALAGTRGREVADQYAAIAARLLTAFDTVTLPGGEPTRVREDGVNPPQARDQGQGGGSSSSAASPTSAQRAASSRPRLPSTVASRGSGDRSAFTQRVKRALALFAVETGQTRSAVARTRDPPSTLAHQRPG